MILILECKSIEPVPCFAIHDIVTLFTVDLAVISCFKTEA